MNAAPNSAVPSLFETEMRSQVESAEAAVIEALATDDPIVVEIARSHLDGLLALAHRNGLEIVPNLPAGSTVVIDRIDLTTPEAQTA